MEELQKLYEQFVNSNMVSAFEDLRESFNEAMSQSDETCEDARKVLEDLTTANEHEEGRTRQVFRGNHGKHSNHYN